MNIAKRDIIMNKIMYYHYRNHYNSVIKDIKTTHLLQRTHLKFEVNKNLYADNSKNKYIKKIYLNDFSEAAISTYYVETINYLLPLMHIYPGDFNKYYKDTRIICGMKREGYRAFPINFFNDN